MKICPYCGQAITRRDKNDHNVFEHAGIIFHGDCRRRALEAAIKACQKEIQQSLKGKK